MSQKKRYARRLEGFRTFKPAGIPLEQIKTNTLQLDELEAIRLIDHEGKSQIEAAEEMEVSRATIQRLVEKGRKKLVETILLNQALKISNDISNIKLKGENKLSICTKNIIKIGFPTKDKVTISKDFNHLTGFMVYTIEGIEIVSVWHVPIYVEIDFNVPILLQEQDVDIVITSNMNNTMIKHMAQNGIDVILGGYGRIDTNLAEYINGFLAQREELCRL